MPFSKKSTDSLVAGDTGRYAKNNLCRKRKTKVYSNVGFTDEKLLSCEGKLASSTFDLQNTFENENAKRHFNEGFCRRYYMLQSCRLFLSKHYTHPRKEPLSPYEATDAAIYLNAYYLNLRAAIPEGC